MLLSRAEFPNRLLAHTVFMTGSFLLLPFAALAIAKLVLKFDLYLTNHGLAAFFIVPIGFIIALCIVLMALSAFWDYVILPVEKHRSEFTQIQMWISRFVRISVLTCSSILIHQHIW